MDDKKTSRRDVLKQLGALSAGFVVAGNSQAADTKNEADELKFPGDEPDHKVVYHFNKADGDYHSVVLSSVSAVLRHYGDNVRIVVSVIGPGIHILAKNPKRPVAKEIQERVSSLNEYGVKFHACGNTLKSLNWTANDIVPFASIVEVGAVDLIELQEQGYSYISW